MFLPGGTPAGGGGGPGGALQPGEVTLHQLSPAATPGGGTNHEIVVHQHSFSQELALENIPVA
eukprot:COSAG02_NODE_56697_length_284_cov_0.832432_1_plen_62_part_01